MSPSSETALQHLRKIKPNDGWDVEYKAGSARLVRLTRRKVPVTDSYFFDIHYDPKSNKVVGILTGISCKTKTVQGQVLVDCTTGRPAGTKIDLVSVSGYNAAQAQPSSTTTDNTTTTPTPTLTDAQNRDIVMFGGAIVVAAIALRIFFSAAFGLSVLLVPAAYLYLVYTCPSMESFDAKKELKRILRGYYLPENHPDKPKGMISETLARIQATVTTEIATLPGYEVTMVPLAGAVVLACARVPSVKIDYYWIGACHQWWYVYGVELKNDGRVQ